MPAGLNAEQLGVAGILVVILVGGIVWLARLCVSLIKQNRDDALAFLKATNELTQVMKETREFFIEFIRGEAHRGSGQQ